MELPKFDKNIPVSIDPNKPNRYGYTKLSDLEGFCDIIIIRYDKEGDDHYHISTANAHSIYIPKVPDEMLYAELEKKDGHFFYTYIGMELQKIINEESIQKTEFFSIDDIYICIENYIGKDNNIYYRYVIDIYHSSYCRIQKIINKTDDIEKEIRELVELFKNMGFKRSEEVSNYIRTHKLGNKYKNIAGFLEMSDSQHNTWIFEGGINPKYYAEICRRLKLDNERSNSYPIGFKSYKDHENK